MNEKFHADILAQPQNWRACLDHSFSPTGLAELKKAAFLLKKSKRVVISGIGASYAAGLAVEFLLKKSGIAAVLEDSSELMHSFFLKKGDALLLLSRSGKSVELVKLLELAKSHGIPTICICNDPQSPLALGCDHALLMNSAFDHTISVSTFSTIILVGILLDRAFQKKLDVAFRKEAKKAVADIGFWMKKGKAWPLLASPPTTSRAAGSVVGGDAKNGHKPLTINDLNPGNAFYFLARGASRAASHAANLLWEEAVKMPATVKTTGSFRHGPQEIVSEKLTVGIWLDAAAPSFQNDLLLVRDLEKLGVQVMKIGATGIELPPVAEPFRLLAEQVPAQLAACFLATQKGSDADSFRFCDYVVETEGGLF